MNRISLPKESDAQIKLFKRACKKHIGEFDSMDSRAHISFPSYPFDLDSSKKVFNYTDYYQMVENHLKIMPPIELTITGFDFLKHGDLRTICAKLNLDPITMAWFNRITQIFKPTERINPHITIAKTISLESFNVLWPHFQKLEFTNTFHVRNITVLHKCSDETGPFRFYREISLRKGN
ncbi:2'-5' RNA ligase family protein [Mucilaginibacter conchicola]|nr:2'-5' RNA ligase family protein [Mucilaginibacter conchicola]